MEKQVFSKTVDIPVQTINGLQENFDNSIIYRLKNDKFQLSRKSEAHSKSALKNINSKTSAIQISCE